MFFRGLDFFAGCKLILFCFVFALAKKLGITDVPAEVVTFISHATQNRLRTVIEKVTVITQHRMESYKVSVQRKVCYRTMQCDAVFS